MGEALIFFALAAWLSSTFFGLLLFGHTYRLIETCLRAHDVEAHGVSARGWRRVGPLRAITLDRHVEGAVVVLVLVLAALCPVFAVAYLSPTWRRQLVWSIASSALPHLADPACISHVDCREDLGMTLSEFLDPPDPG